MRTTKVSATFKELIDPPLIGGWDYICEKYGVNSWCVSEGLVDSCDTMEISAEDARHIGIL